MAGDNSAIHTQWSEDRDVNIAAVCPSFETLSAYFDGELPEIEMRAVRSHVSACPQCAPVIADFRAVNSLLNDAQAYALPRSFTLSPSMTEQERSSPHTPITPFRRAARHARSASLLPVMTAIAALLLIAVIAGDAWSGGGGDADPAAAHTGNVIMIGGVPVTVDDDATFGAASAGTMNGNAESSTHDSGAGKPAAPAINSDSIDWFNWWRPFEALLGLTVALLIVTMLSRRRPRHA
jgi:anti-sigma factor RsiW